VQRSLAERATTSVLCEARGVTVTESVFPAHLRIESHTHDFGYLCVTLAGSVVDTLVHRKLDAAPGYNCWVPARTPHANLFGPSGARCLLLEIDRAALERLWEVEGVEPEPWGAFGGRAAFQGLVLHRMLRAGLGTSLDVDELVVTMLHHASRTPLPSGAQPRWLSRVREMLDATIEAPPSLASLAQEAGVHPMHVIRVFHDHVACSPGQYVQTRRIARACQLLADTAMPLSYVALTVGYYDQSHFTRAFRARMKVTPGAYRALTGGAPGRVLHDIPTSRRLLSAFRPAH